jgi:glutamate-ammonia-ligase adenylyltransferase
VGVLVDAARAEFEAVHGVIPGSELAILGLGRMGGGVLTHASDLDLVFLFSGDFSGESDGGRPIGSTLYYNRLSQRAIAALSVPTAEGALYEIDTRLRPSGEQGPPAASFDSFERYQCESAWTWEHMALARARAIYGKPEAREEIEGIVRRALTAPRDAEKLRVDVLEMRATMADHKPGKGPLDIKLLRGGLVDLEFIVHFLQLREGKGLDPDLGKAVRVLVAEGLVPQALIETHDTLTRFLIAARLLAPDGSEPPPSAAEALARACGYRDWDDTTGQLAAARSEVAKAWQATFGETLEIET